MSNNISLTVRLPHELNENMKITAKQLGFTKTNLIRIAIHDLLEKEKIVLDFSKKYDDGKDRLVLNVNQLAYDILNNACEKYGQSMNAVITSLCASTLEHYSKLL